MWLLDVMLVSFGSFPCSVGPGFASQLEQLFSCCESIPIVSVNMHQTKFDMFSLTNDNSSLKIRPQTRDETQRTSPQKETFLL